MTTNIPKITDQIVHVSRRRFLGGTAGAIAATGAILLPQQTIASDKPISLVQMARALHEAVARYSDQNAPFHFEGQRPSPHTLRTSSLDFALENLRTSSVDDIQCLLKPLFGGAS